MRYFFHTADGSRDRDTEGVDLVDLAAARRQAIMFAGDCMSGNPEILDGRDFRVEVTDDHDLLLFTLITLAINSPVTGRT